MFEIEITRQTCGMTGKGLPTDCPKLETSMEKDRCLAGQDM